MNTKTLSKRALSVIDQYLHFTFGSAVCSVPYFNNKTVRARASLRAEIGKGSPKDIFEEVETVAVKNHIDQTALSDGSLKKLLVESDIGVDCSAFAFYALNAESQETGKGSLDKHMHFVNCRGFAGKIMCALRPVENCDVATMADDKNSTAIPLEEIRPGDVITMTGGPERDERNHILVIHQVEYQNFTPYIAHYSHAAAYPEDGLYNTGIRQGTIEIPEAGKPLTEAHWSENIAAGAPNRILERARSSKTEVRRLRWF
ncbi:MAG: hypothetical protein QOG91_342 [Candidatus Parcubacteria bacterium]|jgi:hypothetical protein|nr:hypothetical protein [Candidatus Parcubacteria bacterium]